MLFMIGTLEIVGIQFLYKMTLKMLLYVLKLQNPSIQSAQEQ